MPRPVASSRAVPTLSFWAVLRFAAGYWVRQPKRFMGVLALLLAGSLLETYLPTALAAFLGAIRQHGDEATVIHKLLIFLGIAAGSVGAWSVLFITYNVFETRIFKNLMDDAFTHIQNLPESFFVNTFTGSIISKITRGRRTLEGFQDGIMHRLLPTFLVLAGSVFFLALHFPLLAAFVGIYLLVVLTASVMLVLNVSGPAQAAYADAQDGFAAHLADSVSGMATVKAYAQEKTEIAAFVAITEALRVKNLRAYHLTNMVGILQRFFLLGILGLLLGGGTWYFFHGAATVEDVAYLAFAYNIIQSYIRDLGETIKNILTASYDLHAIINLLAEVPEVALHPLLPPLQVSQGAIAFNNIRFTYPGKTTPLFNAFSVSIKAGEKVALVGHSGSGKTSFIRLLQCLYKLDAGSITVDGQDITQGSLHSLRSAIALVPQEPILFHRSLHDNIAYGCPGASRAAVALAARQANIESFILSLPQHYDTLVGERGIKLSGGERQRIAIARALLANRPILILDEATSALDSNSEKAIQGALRLLTQGRTSLMIAHRLSTILDADRILVFDQGKIVEEGTHAALLLKPNGIYAGLFKLQSGGFIAA